MITRTITLTRPTRTDMITPTRSVVVSTCMRMSMGRKTKNERLRRWKGEGGVRMRRTTTLQRMLTAMGTTSMVIATGTHKKAKRRLLKSPK